jgi:hypothetical protein
MTPSTNSTSNSSDWTAMPNKLDLLLLNGLTIGVLLLILFGGCGVLTGNPERADLSDGGAAPTTTEFLSPTSDYLTAQATKSADTTDCGYVTGQSSTTDLDAARSCVRSAFADCRAAIYLFDEMKADGTRFTSFVAIEKGGTCSVHVHAVSTDPSRFVGDSTKSCAEISEPIELACGVGG